MFRFYLPYTTKNLLELQSMNVMMTLEQICFYEEQINFEDYLQVCPVLESQTKIT